MEAAEQIESMWPKLRDRQLLAIEMGQFYKVARLNCIMADYLSRWLEFYEESTQTTIGQIRLALNEMVRLLQVNATLYYAYDEVHKFVQDGLTSFNLDNWPVYQLKILHNKCLYLLRKSRSDCLDTNKPPQDVSLVGLLDSKSLPRFFASLVDPLVNRAHVGQVSGLSFVRPSKGISLANIYRCLLEISIYARHKSLSNVLYRTMVESIHFDSIKFKLRLFDSIRCSLEQMRHDDDDDDDDEDGDGDGEEGDDSDRGDDQGRAHDSGDNRRASDSKRSSLANDEQISETFRMKRRKRHLLEHIEKSCFKFSCRLCSESLSFNASTMSDKCVNCHQVLYFCCFTFEPINMVDLKLDGIDMMRAKEILRQNVTLHLKSLIAMTSLVSEGEREEYSPAHSESSDGSGENKMAAASPTTTGRDEAPSAKTITETSINRKSGRLVERMTLSMATNEMGDSDEDPPRSRPLYDSDDQLDPSELARPSHSGVDQIIRQFYSMRIKSSSGSNWRIRDEPDSTESYKLLSYYLIETSGAKANSPDVGDASHYLRTMLRCPITIDKRNKEMIKLINYNDLVFMEQTYPEIRDRGSPVAGARLFLKTNNFVSVCWCQTGCQATFDRRIVEILDSDSRLSNSSNEQVRSGQVLPCPICKSDLVIL